MTVYVVTGRARTGTSMMMRALAEASSLNPVVDPAFDDVYATRAVDEEYHPNPNGYFTAPQGVLPDHVAPGSLIKCQAHHWSVVGPGDYQVVRMIRDESERTISHTRGFGRSESSAALDIIERSEAQLLGRLDAQVITVDYADVIEHPAEVFLRLRAASWPINPGTAADHVDPTLHRNRVPA